MANKHRTRRGLCALAAAGLLLTGCGSLRLLPNQGGATAGTALTTTESAAPTAAPQTLAVYYEQENPAAERALKSYADAQGVTLTTADTPDAAGLAVLGATPAAEGGYRDLSGDVLLAAAAQRAGVAGSFTALPLGKTLYCYWANAQTLKSLLGEDFSAADLQTADWEEWNDFADTLAAWIAAPKKTTVTLSGTKYTLPAEKPESLADLQQVFALPAGAYGGAAYSSALVAADWKLTAGALTGPLTGLANCFALETRCSAAGAADPTAICGANTAVFYRGYLSDLVGALPADACQELVPVPQKCWFTDADLTTTDYNVAGLTNYPVLTTVARLAIPAAAEQNAAKAGAGFILWLYTSDAGETLLTDTLGLVTPWNTASDSTSLGAMQVQLVGSGVIPGAEISDAQSNALAAAVSGPRSQADPNQEYKLDKKAFVTAALQALGAAQGES